MAPSETTRRLSAIFMADVVGYSRLRSEQADVGPYRVHLTKFYPLHHSLYQSARSSRHSWFSAVGEDPSRNGSSLRRRSPPLHLGCNMAGHVLGVLAHAQDQPGLPFVKEVQP